MPWRSKLRFLRHQMRSRVTKPTERNDPCQVLAMCQLGVGKVTLVATENTPLEYLGIKVIKSQTQSNRRERLVEICLSPSTLKTVFLVNGCAVSLTLMGRKRTTEDDKLLAATTLSVPTGLSVEPQWE